MPHKPDTQAGARRPSQDRGHGHAHAPLDPQLASTAEGQRAVKLSLLGLLLTALIQVGVVAVSGSVALLADTVHNFGDALTALPLWLAFAVARRPPSKRYTYGFGRVEDVAGAAIVLAILASAGVAAYQSLERLLNPQPVRALWAVAAAGMIGFAGNELVAMFRIRVGRSIGSAALIADGYHARVDGLTSLGVLLSVVGVWLGYSLADPVVGLAITLAIVRIAWVSAKAVLPRMLDGVDPAVVDQIRLAASSPEGILEVTDVRVRWLGHRLHAEVNLAVDPNLSVSEGHALALGARHRIIEGVPFLTSVLIHVDPLEASGEEHHPPPHGPHESSGIRH